MKKNGSLFFSVSQVGLLWVNLSAAAFGICEKTVPIHHLSSWQGDGVGGGGNSLRCRISGGKVTWSYDRYEAELLYQLSYKLGSASLSYQDKVKLALKRMSDLEPNRAQYYTKLFEDFELQAKCLNATLNSVGDSWLIVKPESCELVQTIVQMKNPKTGEQVYWVDQKAWSELSEDDKAVLAMHEVIYNELIEYGHQNSISARIFNSRILSDDFTSKDEYRKFLGRNEIAAVYFGGIPLEIYSPWQYYSSGRIQRAGLKYHLSSTPEKPGFYLRRIGNRFYQLRSRDDIYFYETGDVFKAHIYGEIRPNFEGELTIGKYQFVFTPVTWTEFHPNGSISKIMGRLRELSPLFLQEKMLVPSEGTFEFYANEKLRSFYLQEGVTLKTKSGKMHRFEAGSRLSLSEEEEVLDP